MKLLLRPYQYRAICKSLETRIDNPSGGSEYIFCSPERTFKSSVMIENLI